MLLRLSLHEYSQFRKDRDPRSITTVDYLIRPLLTILLTFKVWILQVEPPRCIIVTLVKLRKWGCWEMWVFSSYYALFPLPKKKGEKSYVVSKTLPPQLSFSSELSVCKRNICLTDIVKLDISFSISITFYLLLRSQWYFCNPLFTKTLRSKKFPLLLFLI